MNFGKYLGYSNKPCPNCGRLRLENFENGLQVCEKCGWCPQEGSYVSPFDQYEESDIISPELHIGPWVIDDHGWRFKGNP